MAKAGRKSKYDPLTTPALAEEYASELLTDAQIAAKLGIHISTFIDWQKKYREFSVAIKRGKEASNVALVKAMHKTAEGYYVEEEETVVYFDKNKQPKSYSKIVKKRYIPPSTTTQIFLAKNRMPDDFHDVNRHKVDVSGSLKVNTLAELMMEEYGGKNPNEKST
ncbi:MAG: helix-turn-helix domain-containing protein [Synergistaceae bacterium]|nr:helix-turn-helix domain-containing protein [Synergistaceae bacterium]